MARSTVGIEDLDIKGLAKHTPDEVLDEVLTVAEVKYSFRDFYHRWEHQQWKATDIDFSKDAEQWPGLPDIVRQNMLGAMCGFYQGEESVTRNLGPMLMAAPRIEHEIFLSTQIVDEARHLVFFERFFTEVVGMAGDVQDQLAEIRSWHGPWYSTLFFDEKLGLDGRADRLRADVHNVELYAEVVTLYHMILEAGLALLGQRFLLDMCRGLDVLPGFYEGFMAVTRDESRHVGGGVRIIRELRENDPALEKHILKVMRESIPYAVRLISPPDEDYDAAMIDYIPEGYLQSPQESHRYSLTHILKRMVAAGFGKDDINELGAFAWGEFEKAIGEWEARTGGEHFARMFAADQEKGPAKVA
jgi:ribonucleoside-diphosphate reductase beta chain